MTTETQNSYLFISQTLSKQEYYAQSGNKNQLVLLYCSWRSLKEPVS